MTNLIENYSPEVMQDGLNTNKNASFGGTTTISGAASMTSTLAVTGTTTMSGILNIALGTANATFVLSDCGTTPKVVFPQTDPATGFIQVTVAGTTRYIPFYK